MTLQIRALKLQLSPRQKLKRFLRLRPKMKRKSRDRQEKNVDKRVELLGKREKEKDVPETKRRERTDVEP